MRAVIVAIGRVTLRPMMADATRTTAKTTSETSANVKAVCRNTASTSSR
jgi:hypothetical protein